MRLLLYVAVAMVVAYFLLVPDNLANNKFVIKFRNSFETILSNAQLYGYINEKTADLLYPNNLIVKSKLNNDRGYVYRINGYLESIDNVGDQITFHLVNEDGHYSAMLNTTQIYNNNPDLYSVKYISYKVSNGTSEEVSYVFDVNVGIDKEKFPLGREYNMYFIRKDLLVNLKKGNKLYDGNETFTATYFVEII